MPVMDPAGGDRAAPGSSLYYALLFTDRARRAPVAAVYALEEKLLRSLHMQDPGAARLRLQWWRDEIARARHGAAQHPLIQTLQPLLRAGRLDESLLMAATAGIEAELAAGDRDRYEDIETEFARHFGSLWRLAAAASGVDDRQALDLAARLGGLHQLHRALQALARNLARGFCRPVPRTELVAAGLAPERPPEADARWRALLDSQFGRLQERLEQACSEFPAPAAARACHALILARLDIVLCREIRRDGCRIFGQRYALTPLRKLWLAWRTHRRILRHQT